MADTGLFEDLINKDISSEGYVYENILRSGNMEVIYDPGRESLCQKSPKKNSCQEEIEISMLLRLGSDIIGVIGLVGRRLQRHFGCMGIIRRGRGGPTENF